MLQGEKRQEGAAEHFQRARDDPAGAGHQHRRPPALAVGAGFFRQKAQVVDLFANLRHQRQGHGAGGAERQQVEAATFAFPAGKAGQVAQGLRVLDDHKHIRQQQQQQPHRLAPDLQAIDQGDAIGHQGNDQDRAKHIGQRQRNLEIQLQGQGHDRRFEGKEQEGETGVDQRGDGRADIAKAGAAGQQVHVHAVARGVVTDGQAGEEDDQAHRQNRPQGIGEAIAQGQGAADGLQGQERHGAQGGVGDAQLRPLAKRLGREAQGVVFQGLVGDPAVVVAADLGNPLRAVAQHEGDPGEGVEGQLQHPCPGLEARNGGAGTSSRARRAPSWCAYRYVR